VRLTLLVPELIWPEPNDQLTLGKLAHRASNGWPAMPPSRASPKRLSKLPSPASSASTMPPSAPCACSAKGNGEQARKRSLAVRRPGAPALSPRTHHPRRRRRLRSRRRRSPRLVAALNVQFADVGIFYIATARRWYLKLNATVEHFSEPISKIAGRRLDSELTDKNGPLTAGSTKCGLHPLLARLYAARGITDNELDYEPQVAAAAGRADRHATDAAQLLADAIEAGARMLIVADYDCDGATACAVGMRALRAFGADVDYLVPDRFELGYGLSPAIVDSPPAGARPDHHRRQRHRQRRRRRRAPASTASPR
jgi:hypothetical protein